MLFNYKIIIKGQEPLYEEFATPLSIGQKYVDGDDVYLINDIYNWPGKTTRVYCVLYGEKP